MKIIGNTVSYVLLKGLKYGLILGALYGTTIMPIVGTLYGLFFGAIMGLILGLVDGLIIGFVTYRFFNPAQSEKHFRRTVVTLAALVTYSGAVIFLLMLYSTAELGDFRFVQLPALIAGGSAIYAVRGFIKRYLKRDESPGMMSPPPEIASQNLIW